MDLMKMMKQAKELQEKMSTLQEEVADFEVEGSSGGGLVRLTLSGKGIMSKLTIDQTLFNEDEKEILEDLIVAAYNDAKSKSETLLQEKTQEALSGLNLPEGVKLPI